MKTSKPFSTISYNSEPFLRHKLDDLISRRVLSFYAFVKHFREADERKDHIHLIMFPNGQYQTDALQDYLSELDPLDPVGLPLGVMPFQSSKFGDWFLYCCHDAGYLASKNQVRQHHYAESDFVTSDSDYLHELVTLIDCSKYHKTQEFVEKVLDGVPFSEMVRQGQIPVAQFNQWLSMYAYLNEGMPFRYGRSSHTPMYDPETGELLSDDVPPRT